MIENSLVKFLLIWIHLVIFGWNQDNREYLLPGIYKFWADIKILCFTKKCLIFNAVVIRLGSHAIALQCTIALHCPKIKADVQKSSNLHNLSKVFIFV